MKGYGFRTARIRVIYNGVEVCSHLPGADEKRQTRAQWGFSLDDFVICYFGRLSEEKGVHLLLEAMTTLDDNVKCLIIGEGPQKQELRTRVSRTGLENRVHFAGFLAHPEAVVAVCNVSVVPSIVREAFGRSVIEALALAMPVVVARIGGMSELFEHGHQGLYFSPGNAAELAQALLCLAGDRQKCIDMGHAGRTLVMERYSLDRVATEYCALYGEEHLLAEVK